MRKILHRAFVVGGAVLSIIDFLSGKCDINDSSILLKPFSINLLPSVSFYFYLFNFYLRYCDFYIFIHTYTFVTFIYMS